MGVKRTKPLFSLADQLFNEQSVTKLATAFASAQSDFNPDNYVASVLKQFPELELKARIQCMVTELEAYLPQDYNQTLGVLRKVLPAPLDPKLADDDFGEFIWSVPGEYVAKHGCQKERLAQSLAFLKEATKRFTCETPIRPFLAKFPKETMHFVHECAADNNYHVRRLASEGIRPYLPWAQKVVLPPDEITRVLTKLYDDPTRYVVRSVANTLNDLSRDNPDLVLATLKQWYNKPKNHNREFAWLTQHALRTLVKQDHSQALSLLGYSTEPKFRLSSIVCAQSIEVGGALAWQAELTSLQNQKLKIFLRVYFLRADGSYSTKNFALKDGEFAQKERSFLQKNITFKPLSTRTLYPGVHHIELVANGVTRGKRSFNLTA